MNVFFPFKKSQNSFLDEIEREFEGNFYYDDYYNIEKYDIDVINIHWPEAILESHDFEMESFKKWFNSYRYKYPIVYTRHNSSPHTNRKANLVEFYAFINSNSYAIHHLGQFSLAEHGKMYPDYNGVHAVIPHPLYSSIPNSIDMNEAREKLKIPQDAKVILVFGAVRKEEERKLIMEMFNLVADKKKYLLVPNFGYYAAPKFLMNRLLKNIFSKFKTFFFNLKSNVSLSMRFVNENEIQFYFNSANVIFIPRTDSLNSGVIFLATSFKKPVVVPHCGNLHEFVIDKKLIYDPNNFLSLKNTINYGLNSKNVMESSLENHALRPRKIACALKQFFTTITEQFDLKSGKEL